MGLHCPSCGSLDSAVKDSRDAPAGIKRKRMCLSCQARWSTKETVQIGEGEEAFDLALAALNAAEFAIQQARAALRQQHEEAKMAAVSWLRRA